MIGSSLILDDATVRAVVAYRTALREFRRLTRADLSKLSPARSGEHFDALVTARARCSALRMNLEALLEEDT